MEDTKSWTETIGKKVKSNNGEDIGKIHALGKEFIEVDSGIISKSKYYIPKYYVNKFDGDYVHLELTSEEIEVKYQREKPPLSSEYETKEYMEYKAKKEENYPQFVHGVPFMAREPDLTIQSDSKFDIPWNEVVHKHVRSSDNIDIGDVERIGNGYIVVKDGVANIRYYYIPNSYIDNYDGSNLYIKSPSGLISARFERETEPSPEELELLIKDKPKDIPNL